MDADTATRPSFSPRTNHTHLAPGRLEPNRQDHVHLESTRSKDSWEPLIETARPSNSKPTSPPSPWSHGRRHIWYRDPRLRACLSLADDTPCDIATFSDTDKDRRVLWRNLEALMEAVNAQGSLQPHRRCHRRVCRSHLRAARRPVGGTPGPDRSGWPGPDHQPGDGTTARRVGSAGQSDRPTAPASPGPMSATGRGVDASGGGGRTGWVAERVHRWGNGGDEVVLRFRRSSPSGWIAHSSVRAGQL